MLSKRCSHIVTQQAPSAGPLYWTILRRRKINPGLAPPKATSKRKKPLSKSIG